LFVLVEIGNPVVCVPEETNNESGHSRETIPVDSRGVNRYVFPVPGWSNADYRKAFTEGHERNKYVASLISKEGLWAYCPPLKFAKNGEEIKSFTVHEKDVLTRAGTLEIKGQGRRFTWDVNQFPHPTQIVDTVESWEEKAIKPIAYVMVCNENMNCVVVPCSTRGRWRVERRYDRYKKKDFDFYVADSGVIRPFSELLDFLRRKEAEWKERSKP